jgi:hypothetical protein
VVALVLRPRPLEKRSMRQDVRGRLSLTEKLLRREQVESPCVRV